MEQLSLHRIHQLADPGSYVPFDSVKGGAFHLGRITINDRPAYVLATDVDQPARISPFKAISRQVAFLESIREAPAPLVQMLDIPAHMKELQGKTPIPPEAMHLLAAPEGMGGTYGALGRLEGLVPRVSLLFGPIGASLSFPATLSDAMGMTEQASLCIGRPDAVTLMTGQTTSFEALGGADVHYRKTGMAHAVTRTEAGLLTWARQWLSYWPDHAGAPMARTSARPSEGDIRLLGKQIEQANLNTPIDMEAVIHCIADSGSWLETRAGHARECMTGLCRVKGRPVALLASRSEIRGGILHPETCRKMTMFIQTCGSFGLPLVFLADTPGFMVGEAVEHTGNVQAASDLYTAIAKTPSPKVCVVIRKAYSAGLYAMAGAGFGAGFWAMPGASVSVFGPEALKRFSEDREMPPASRQAAETMLEDSRSPEQLQEQGLIDRIVPWESLRSELAGFAKKR